MQVVPITCEQPAHVRGSLGYAVIASLSCASLLYMATGVFGYVNFGSTTPVNILTGFSSSDVVVDVAKVLILSPSR